MIFVAVSQTTSECSSAKQSPGGTATSTSSRASARESGYVSAPSAHSAARIRSCCFEASSGDTNCSRTSRLSRPPVRRTARCMSRSRSAGRVGWSASRVRRASASACTRLALPMWTVSRTSSSVSGRRRRPVSCRRALAAPDRHRTCKSTPAGRSRSWAGWMCDRVCAWAEIRRPTDGSHLPERCARSKRDRGTGPTRRRNPAG